MADNTSQSGSDTIATDDIGGGVKVQRVKPGFGVDGTLTDVAASARLPVQSVSSIDRLIYEGDPSTILGTPFSGTLTSGAANQTLITFSLPSLNRAFWCESAVVSSNKQFDMQFAFGTVLGYTGIGQITRVLLDAFGQVTLPLRVLLRPGLTTAVGGSTTIGTIANRNGIDSVLTGALVNMTITGVSLYDDFDMGADKVGLIIGDSILNATAGVTQKYYSTEWLIREYFRAAGTRLRLVSKAISGSTSTDHERQRAFGMYDLPQVNLIIYMLGSNDAIQAVSAATHKANVAAAISWKQRTYPLASMLVIASPPLENNTSEAALALIRAAGAQAVSEAGDAKVISINLTDCFDRTNSAFYASSDTPGSRVHPSDAGHAAMFTVIDAALDAAGLVL